MSKAAELAALIGSQSALSNRNLIINGAMQVAQRGTSSTSNGYATVDRWNTSRSNLDDAVITFSQDTDVPSGEGFAKSFKVNVGTAESALAADEQLNFHQRFEGQNLQSLKKGTSSAVSSTVSFFVKSNTTGTYIVELFDNDNSRIMCKSYTISSANTWEKKIITFPGDTTGAMDNDANRSMDIRWWLAAGTDFTSGSLGTSWASTVAANRAVGQVNLLASTNNWYITGIQWELGEQATPFEHRSFADEYNRCLRYTYVPRNDSVSTSDGSAFSIGYCNSGPVGVYCAVFPVPMRDIPTLTTTSSSGALEQAYHNNSVTSHNATDMTYLASISGNQKGWFIIGGASFSGGESAHCRYATGNIADNIIVFSAEL